jgi:hypothetical protein
LLNRVPINTHDLLILLLLLLQSGLKVLVDFLGIGGLPEVLKSQRLYKGTIKSTFEHVALSLSCFIAVAIGFRVQGLGFRVQA